MSQPFRPPHLSVSSVQLFMRCPAQFLARYVTKVDAPPTPPMLFGKTFAVAIEALHLGQDAETVFAREHAAASRQCAALGQQLRPGAEFGLALLDLYRDRGVIAGTPERKFALHLPSTRIPVPILGFMDLDAADSTGEVVEVKTSRANWTRERAQSEHQAHVYGWAYQRLHGRKARCIRYLIFSTATPRLTEIEVAPSPDGLRLFELAAEATWRGIERGEFTGCGRCPTCKPAPTGNELETVS